LFSIDRQTDEKLKKLNVLSINHGDSLGFFYLSVCQWRMLESACTLSLAGKHSPKTDQLKIFSAGCSVLSHGNPTLNNLFILVCLSMESTCFNMGVLYYSGSGALSQK
jgi:hypothetical protein